MTSATPPPEAEHEPSLVRHNRRMAQEPFGDIPLFREIQRILSSSEGPVNFEIGRQVAVALATEGMSDTDVQPETTRALQDAVGSAERLVAGYARLALDEPVLAEGIGKA